MVHHIISECFKFKLQQNCTHNMQDKTAETHNMQDKTAETYKMYYSRLDTHQNK